MIPVRVAMPGAPTPPPPTWTVNAPVKAVGVERVNAAVATSSLLKMAVPGIGRVTLLRVAAWRNDKFEPEASVML